MDRNGLRAKLVRISKDMRSIVDGAKTEGRELTEDEQTLFDEYKADYEGAEKSLETLETMENIEADLNSLEPAVAAPQTLPAGPPAKREFESFGEFMNAVCFNKNDQRLHFQQGVGAQSDQSTLIGSDGGFMVPTQFVNDLLRVPTQAGVVRPRARVIPAGSPPDSEVTIPALDQTSAENMFGGVTVSWIGEGATKPQTDAKFREVKLKPKEVACHIRVTDKLLRNWGAADAVLSELMRNAIVAAEDQAFLTGNGANRPLGFLHASNGSLISAARGTANQIAYADVTSMVGSTLEDGGNLVWLASPSTRPQLMTIEDTNGNNLWMPSARESTPETLIGYPIIYSHRVPSLGTAGDLCLVDLSYYLVKDGSGIFVDSSRHVEFTANKTYIKAFFNVDGSPWLTESLTLENGDTVSPFVTLAA